MELVEEPLIIETHIKEDREEIEIAFTSLEISEEEANRNEPATVISSNLNSKRKEPSTKKESREEVSDDKFNMFFYKVSGSDGKVDAFELQRLMAMIFANQFPKNKEFSLEACRAMIACMDTHRTGSLNITQFKKLWEKILFWKHTFEVSDLNKDRKIDFPELGIAMAKLGLQLSEENLTIIFNRFQNRRSLIELDDFMQICCKAVNAKKVYKRDFISDEKVLTLEDFFAPMIYN